MQDYNMNSLGIGPIAAGGFLFGVGLSGIVPFAGIISVAGIILIAVGLIVLFANRDKQNRRKGRRS
jgi:hypothetical protein